METTETKDLRGNINLECKSITQSRNLVDKAVLTIY